MATTDNKKQFLDFAGLSTLINNVKKIVSGKAQKTEGCYFIKGTQTAATNLWTGELPADITDYYDGMSIDYLLPVAGTSTAATLNLGGKGAKPIYVGNGTSGPTTTYPANSVIHMTYIVKSDMNSGNGCWKVSAYVNSTYANYSFGNGYGTCSTAEATVAKVGTYSSYVLSTGGRVSIKFTYAVPANATLNINSKGAKAIYYKGAAITAGIIKAGDIATFVYDGTQYQLVGTDRTIAIADWALAASKPTYTASEVGAATSGHNHSGVYQAAGTYVTASRATSVEDTLTNSNAKIANSAAVKTFVEGKGYLVASDISGKADLSGATFTGNITIGGTTINATNGHIITASGLEIY